MGKKLKKDTGITLIALIVTILIMLILAAVTVSKIVEGNLIEKAQQASEKQEEASMKERIIAQINAKRLETLEGITEDMAYEIISSYDKNNDINDKLGNPYIENDEGIKVYVSEIYDFEKEYFIRKLHENTFIISEGTEITTLESALDQINASNVSTAMIYINIDNISWNAESTIIPNTNETLEELIIYGGSNNCTFNATGSDYAKISAENGANIIFENLIINDETGNASNTSWELTYLEFLGKMQFQNCKFNKGIQLKGTNTEMTFTDCTFYYGNESNVYNVWILDGEINFNKCRFEGKRYIKVHEAYGSNVNEVTIEDCIFNLSSSVKPCLAIGTLDSTTSVVMQNNKIYYYSDSSKGDLDNYIYESDTDITTFIFTNTNNSLISGE